MPLSLDVIRRQVDALEKQRNLSKPDILVALQEIVPEFQSPVPQVKYPAAA